MEITINNLLSETEDSIMEYYLNEIKKELNIKTEISKNGILYSIFKIACDYEINIQNCLNYLIKQFDPDSADVLQDALFERIGVSRLKGIRTEFSLQLKGDPNRKIDKKEILLQSKPNNYEFYNTDEFITDANGLAEVNFACKTLGNISITPDIELSIIQAPSTISEISGEQIYNILAGKNRESNFEYLTRYNNSKSENARATANATLSYLAKFVEDLSFIKIKDPNNDNDIQFGTVKIIAKPKVSDKEFAEAIFNCFATGIKYLGNTSIITKDILNNPVEIKFQKADEIPINLSIQIKTDEEQDFTELCELIKTNIINYTKSKILGLGSSVFANDFMLPISGINGIKAIRGIKIKKLEDELYSGFIQLTEYELPTFDKTMINIEKE